MSGVLAQALLRPPGMRTALDSYLGIHPQALALEKQRIEVLAANIANVDTPNYKARDIDFKTALAAASSATTGVGANLALTQPAASTAAATPPTAIGSGAPSSPGGADAADLQYRVPMAPSLDGNTVDEQLEQSAFAENSVRYQTTLTILGSKMRDLMTAITGS